MRSHDVKTLFGRRMRQLRLESGLSQEKFAAIISLDRSYVGSVERGERNVSLENICAIASGLNVDPFELLRFDAIPSEPQSDE